MSCAVKDSGSSFPDSWPVIPLLGQSVAASFDKHISTAWDLRGISFSASSCPAVKHHTALPGAGQQEACRSQQDVLLPGKHKRLSQGYSSLDTRFSGGVHH